MNGSFIVEQVQTIMVRINLFLKLKIRFESILQFQEAEDEIEIVIFLLVAQMELTFIPSSKVHLNRETFRIIQLYIRDVSFYRFTKPSFKIFHNKASQRQVQIFQ